jgi:transposase
MQVHARARLTPKGRALVVERVLKEGWSARAAAEAAGVAERTVYRWIARYRGEGEGGLLDRSSAPHTIPHRTPRERVVAILALRRLRMTSTEIAELLAMPISTVSVVLKREGLGKLSRLEPPEPPNRYERSRPGELIHIDVKKLGRILKPGHRVTGNRRGQLSTHPNGKAVRPYRPRTNGKAERFIQTMLREWAYGRVFPTSAERTAALPSWLERYNWRRPHGSLGHQPPASRLTNVAGNYS